MDDQKIIEMNIFSTIIFGSMVKHLFKTYRQNIFFFIDYILTMTNIIQININIQVSNLILSKLKLSSFIFSKIFLDLQNF